MKKVSLTSLVICLCLGCASYQTQITKDSISTEAPLPKTPSHRMLLLGNLEGKRGFDLGEILTLKKGIQTQSNDSSTVLFLGNAFGQLEGHSANSKIVREQVSNYGDLLASSTGQAIFIPGKTEWEQGVDWIEALDNGLVEKFGEKSFLPKNGCPIASRKLGETAVLVTIDSQWYLNDWDDFPKMNDQCEIKDRAKFLAEFESLVKKNTDKTLIVAMHHPVLSNGNYGGHYSFGQSLTPLPVVGSVKTAMQKMGGFTADHLQNEAYRSFRKQLMTLSKYNPRVLFVAAHEKNLQYIHDDGTHQIISGSAIQSKPARLADNGLFASGSRGYAGLDFYDDGKVHLAFFDDHGELLYQHTVIEAFEKEARPLPKKKLPPATTAQIYPDQDTEKSGFHSWFWGDRYREYYSEPVTVPVIDLDTLMGGMTVLRKGGGHQSISLRLKSKDGRQFVMRALEKSAEAYLQAMVAKEEFIIGKVKGTAPERVLKDFYTGSHPYAPFVVGALADVLDIYHTNPLLCYIPKQARLGRFNEEFGDKLFMIEERVTSGHGNQASFGFADTIIGTDHLIARMASDEKYEVDQERYVRARLFDMLLGDWDRHDDQWRWAEFKEKDRVVYRPIPRDRDQVFSIMGDGFLMGVATRAVPGLRLMEGFQKEIRSVEGFNSSPKTFALDMLLLPETTEAQWLAQAKAIQDRIDEAAIDAAFKAFPKEIRKDSKTEWIKEVLLARKKGLHETAKAYYKIINKISVVIGTDKDDHFRIEDLGNGITEVSGYRIIKGKLGTRFFNKTYDRNTTKEVWIYGLDDKDVFELIGKGKRGPKIRLVGGLNNDTYQLAKRGQVFVYDYKSQKNSFDTPNGKKRLTDHYDTNTYNPYQVKENQNFFLPFVGFNPDDGIQLLASNTFTHNGFIKAPFTSKHHISAGFYFATSGYDFSYQGDFVRFWGKAGLRIKAEITGPNFTTNFFGFGNESENFDDDLELDFNRVKIESIGFEPSLVWNGRHGSEFSIGGFLKNYKVEATEDRFIESFYDANPDIENENAFLGIRSEYGYENLNNKAFPTLGLTFNIAGGYTWNITNGEDAYAYVVPELQFHYPIIASGAVVLSSRLGGQVNFGDDFQFYQGATLGAQNGLRAYRFQRFTGKRSFYQSSDLKIVTHRIRTGLVPLYFGIYGGYDYGRVWVSGDASDSWNDSFGGGIFINGIGIITLQAGLFNGEDGNRVNFGFSIGL